jgi:uncharacterized protein YpuA (DUF1002 family)
MGFKEMKYLKLFEDIKYTEGRNGSVYKLFEKEYTDEKILDIIKDLVANYNIFIADEDIQDIDTKSLDNSLSRLNDLYQEPDDYSGDEDSIDDIGGYILEQFLGSSKMFIIEKIRIMTEKYIGEQLTKIFKYDNALFVDAYRHWDRLIDDLKVDIPQNLKRNIKSGLWDLKTKKQK